MLWPCYSKAMFSMEDLCSQAFYSATPNLLQPTMACHVCHSHAFSMQQSKPRGRREGEWAVPNIHGPANILILLEEGRHCVLMARKGILAMSLWHVCGMSLLLIAYF